MPPRFTVPLLLSLTSVALHLQPHASSLLEFNRSALAHGEFWRLFTGHLVHFNSSHLAWDVLTLLLLSAMLPPLKPQSWLGLLGGAAAVISSGLWLRAPQLESYRGLSGLDCTLFGAVMIHFALQSYREHDHLVLTATALSGLGFLGKCAWEILQGSTFFVHSTGDFVPVPLAHLLGACWGVGFILLLNRNTARSLTRVQRTLTASAR